MVGEVGSRLSLFEWRFDFDFGKKIYVLFVWLEEFNEYVNNVISCRVFVKKFCLVIF